MFHDEMVLFVRKVSRLLFLVDMSSRGGGRLFRGRGRAPKLAKIRDGTKRGRTKHLPLSHVPRSSKVPTTRTPSNRVLLQGSRGASAHVARLRCEGVIASSTGGCARRVSVTTPT